MRNSQGKLQPNDATTRVYTFHNLTEQQIEQYFIMRAQIRALEAEQRQLKARLQRLKRALA